MNSRILLLFITLFFIGCKVSQVDPTTEVASKTKVFLFAGQSNMDGRANGGGLSAADLARLERVGPRIRFYYNHHPVTPLQLTEPKEYIQRKFSLTKSFGPELFFGIELAEQYPEETFIFIKRAQGGTSLYGCWNPEWSYEKAQLMKEEEKPKLYQDFINYAKAVLGEYGEPYELEAMFWVQGETDSGVKKWGPIPGESYRDNLKNLVYGVRQEMKKDQLPFIMFQVGGGKVVEGMQQLAEQEADVYLLPQSRDKNADDFYVKNPPPIGHYTAKSMKVIGERFYQIYTSTKE